MRKRAFIFFFFLFCPTFLLQLADEYAVQTETKYLTQRSLLALLGLITLVVFTFACSFIFLAFQLILDTMNGGKNVNVVFQENERHTSRRYEYVNFFSLKTLNVPTVVARNMFCDVHNSQTPPRRL